MKINKISSLFLVCIMLCSLFPATMAFAETAEYIWDGTTTDWTVNNVDLNGTRNADFGNPSFGTAGGEGIWSAIYDGVTWKANYTITSRAYMLGYGADKRLNVYFNWQDPNNYYRMSVAGDNNAKQIAVQIYENINGTETRTLSYNTTDEDIKSSRVFSYSLTYNNGNVKVSVTNASGVTKDIIDHNLTSPTLTSGKIGFYTAKNNGEVQAYVDSVSVSGEYKVEEPPEVIDPNATVYEFTGETASWDLTNGAKINSDTKIINNSWNAADLKCLGIHRRYWWSGDYTYKITANNGGNVNGNEAHIYFNYKDSKNYYCLKIGGSDPAKEITNTVVLAKMEDGTLENIASSEEVHKSRSYEVTIKQEGGILNISYINNDENYTPFEPIALAENVNAGFIGIGTSNTKGDFSKIKVYGDGRDVSLDIESSSVADGATDVNVNLKSIDIICNFDISPESADPTNIILYKKGAQTPVSEALYDVEWKLSEPNKFKILFLKDLEYKTQYEIILTNKILSDLYSTSFTETEKKITFTTVSPIFNVDAVLTANGEAVADIFAQKGNEIDFALTLDNGNEFSQDYIVSVCVFNPNGKLLRCSLFKDTLEAKEKDSATVSGSLMIPNTAEPGAKVYIFIWDNAEKMNILYPCITF